jgi:ATP-dependent protease ClpP protease subunit
MAENRGELHPSEIAEHEANAKKALAEARKESDASCAFDSLDRLAKRKNWWIDSAECLKLGLVDEVR